MPSHSERCDKCQFWLPMSEVCRRYPPVIQPAGMSHGVQCIGSGFPKVRIDWWCGEFRAATAAASEGGGR